MTQTNPYADARAIARSTVVGLYTPPERLTVDRWVEKHRVHSEEGASGNARGRWDCSITPYLIGLLRAHTDPEPREIALWKSTQVGATDGWLYNTTLFDAYSGLSQMLVYPTQSKGQDKNRRALVPAFKSTAPFVNITSESKLTADELRLSNGTLVWFAYTGSRDSLRGDPCGHIKCDEIDAYDSAREDPLENCRSRARTYGDSKIEKTSTPMGDTTGITKEYHDADARHQYHCPCPSCGQFFELWEFELLDWYGGVDIDPKEAARRVGIKCPHCSVKIEEENKPWMVQHGLWITETESIDSDGSITATLDPVNRRRVGSAPMLCRLTADFFRDETGQPDPRVRDQGMGPEEAEALRQQLGVRVVGERQRGPNWGFRINTLASLIAEQGWAGLVYGFVRDKGRPNATWWRDNLGQSPTRTAKSIEVSSLMQLCVPRHRGGHEHGQCPAWMTSCFGAVDIQKDCIKIGVWAFSEHAKRVAMVKSIIVPRSEELALGEPHLDKVITDLTRDAGLPVQTADPLGGDFEDRRARPALLIDSGHWTNDVYAWVRRLRDGGCPVFPCKGVENRPDDPRPFRMSDIQNHKLPSGERIVDHRQMPLVLVNTDYWKDVLAARLSPLDEGLIESLVDEHGHPVEPLFYPAQLPGTELWVDEHGHPVAARVLKELCAEHKILIGAGSGQSGKLGLGRLREVWRKKREHLKNDFGDIAVYSFCNAGVYGVFELMPASVARQGVPDERRAQTPVNDPAADTHTPVRAPRIQSGFGRR